MENFIAVKSKIRHYGYSMKDKSGTVSWIVGPDHQAGWYKRKRDAQHAADVHNKAVIEGRIKLI